MKIVIAPDSYKESLSAAEVAQAIEKGFREIFPDAQYVSVPVADGGEGTVEAMIAATQGVERTAWVTGPLGEKVKACWGMSGDGKTAFIEMAAASGLALVPPEKRTLSPLPDPTCVGHRRFALCCTGRRFPPQALPGTLPYGARTFLPSARLPERTTTKRRLSGQLRRAV